jgi:aminoglycoside phosphotransferase
VIAGRPTDAVGAPPAVRQAIGSARAEVVWRNELDGLTFEVVGAAGRRFVKWAPAGSGLDLVPEVDRLAWLAGRWPAPRVVGTGQDETGSWIMTTPVPGESAVTQRWQRNPEVAVRAIGEGLRAMHETLPVDECPFSWSAEQRCAQVRERAAEGLLDRADWHEVHHSLSVEHALARLASPPAIDRLVVCHGDACAPNTLIDARGRWTGHVDFGSLGTADRWADLAVATWSTEWNYGPGWSDELLAAYGIAVDPERIAYYRLLWDLG